MCRFLPHNESVTFFNESCVVGICLFAEPPSCPNDSLKICSSCDISVLYVEILLKYISLFNFSAVNDSFFGSCLLCEHLFMNRMLTVKFYLL